MSAFAAVVGIRAATVEVSDNIDAFVVSGHGQDWQRPLWRRWVRRMRLLDGRPPRRTALRFMKLWSVGRKPVAFVIEPSHI